MPASVVSFKRSLTALLQSYIDLQKPLTIDWYCSFCHDGHNGNLFKKVTSILENIVSDDLKADLGLMTQDQRLFAAIHISKNKKPITKAVEYYREQDIIYIQISPNDNPFESISNPLFVGTCLNPKCKKCGSFQGKKSMVIIDSKCWKCEGPMKVAVLEYPGHHLGPDRFTQNELIFASSKGVLIQNNYSKTMGHAYLSNTCPSCHALTGDHFLFTNHFNEAMNGYYTYERFPAGYFCETCYRNS